MVSGKCLFLSGFTEEQLNHMHDTILPTKYRMGFTNMVARASPGSKDLSRWVNNPVNQPPSTQKPSLGAFHCLYVNVLKISTLNFSLINRDLSFKTKRFWSINVIRSLVKYCPPVVVICSGSVFC